MNRTPIALVTLAALAFAGAPTPASAETVNCSPIGSLPAVLSTQGVYCLTKDLATTMASGNAITVAVNNVTIDCNGFKLGGLGAGPVTNAVAIRAQGRQNVVVRNCNVRGFAYGINLDGGGHVIEGNRLDGNTRGGILVVGNGSLVSDNRILGTGGSTSPAIPTYGIYTAQTVDIVGNAVSGVTNAAGSSSIGIYTYANNGGAVDRNRVRGVVSTGGSPVYAIRNLVSVRLSARGNQLNGETNIGTGLDCGSADSIASGNMFFGFDNTLVSCRDGGANFNK